MCDHGSTNGTNGYANGTICSPNGTVGTIVKSMAPLATNGTIGKIYYYQWYHWENLKQRLYVVRNGITILIPQNTDNSVPLNSIAMSRGIQANRSFRFWVVSDRTVSRDSLAIIPWSVLVPMANDHKHDAA